MTIISVMRKHLHRDVSFPFRDDNFGFEDRVSSMGLRDVVSSFMPSSADRKLDD